MRSDRPEVKDIDSYISGFPMEKQELLNKIRETIKMAAPESKEKISYGMPAFYQDGNLVYFAAFAGHIGFYPTPSAIEAFKEELSAYEVSKGTVRFPNSKPIPYHLITEIVKFRVLENKEKARKKR